MSFLSDSQINCVVTSWEAVKAAGQMSFAGQEMFLTLFKKAPSTLKIFRSFCEDPLWEQSPLFGFHCDLVSASIDAYISLLKDHETRKMKMMFLGLKHSHFSITHEHLLLMMTGLVNCIQRVNGEFDEETSAAFNTIAKEFAHDFISAMAKTEATL